MENNLKELDFLNMIHDRLVSLSIDNHICASSIAAIAIKISSFGTSKLFYNTRNIFLTIADRSWYGKCYSKDTGEYHDKSEYEAKSGEILYRVYDDHRDSINDFISYLISSRRSENGPYRYDNFKEEYDYKKSLDKLIRSGFLEDYIRVRDTATWYNESIALIEKYHLYEWDNEVKKGVEEMSKKKKNPRKEEKMQSAEHMYRVRLEWDKRDTQIFSSPIFEDALREAKKHEGYKIFIDDDGELFEDPWAKKEEEPKEEVDDRPEVYKENPDLHRMLHPVKNKSIILKNTPVYRNAKIKEPFGVVSGEYYFYDNLKVNHRVRIVKNKIKDSDIPNPDRIFGYISDIVY